MVKIKDANLLNILAGKELVHELLQWGTVDKITAALRDAIANADMSEYRKNLDKLKPAHGTPSANAAKKIVELIASQG